MTSYKESKSVEGLMELWSRSLVTAASGALKSSLPDFLAEAGRHAATELEGQGLVLQGSTPVETINSVYGYFTSRGYLVSGRAANADGAQDGSLVELHEQRAGDVRRWCVNDPDAASLFRACLCHNVIRYAVGAGFGLQLSYGDLSVDETGGCCVRVRLESADEPGCSTGLTKEQDTEGEGQMRGSWDFKRAVSMSIDAVISIDEDGVITLWNPAAERLFGFTAGEAIGSTVEIIMPPEYREKHRRGLADFVSTGRAKLIGQTVEIEAVKKDGERIAIELSLAADKVGGHWAFTGVIRDVSERVRLKTEVKQRLVEMERLNMLMVGREIKMEELRAEIRTLRARVADQHSGKRQING